MENKFSLFSRLPKKHTHENMLKRKEWVSQRTGIQWDDSEKNSPEEYEGILENHLGFINLPIAIAYPLLIQEATYAQGKYVVPVVTLEGSLVSSMSRGMLASYRSGGVRTSHIKQSVSRSPAFFMKDIYQTKNFMDWVEKNFSKIKEVTDSGSRFGRLLKIDKYPLQKYVVLDFIFSTANAAGQNMVSICSLLGCEFIKSQTGKKYYLESNFSGDKKYSHLNVLRGRGHYVIAETKLTTSVLRRILGCEVKDFMEMYNMGLEASIFAGTTGIQLHIANALAGIYLAVGQDVACVAENSIGFSEVRTVEDGIVLSITMPSLTVGTVGGGTRLTQQRKNLSMLGCVDDEHSSKKLAEIICASALCLEISLISAIISGGWVNAHMRYGRSQTSKS